MRTEIHCTTLQDTATHCKTLQDTARHCKTLQDTARHCKTLQHTARHCKTLKRNLLAVQEAATDTIGQKCSKFSVVLILCQTSLVHRALPHVIHTRHTSHVNVTRHTSHVKTCPAICHTYTSHRHMSHIHVTRHMSYIHVTPCHMSYIHVTPYHMSYIHVTRQVIHTRHTSHVKTWLVHPAWHTSGGTYQSRLGLTYESRLQDLVCPSCPGTR